uniref:MIP24587p n=1 Tax=Drosophila melanogaster TaxID=7227 RepID=D9PTU0_DROME|nr:MIP24587p [Drosophila melanogaster]
MPAASSHSRLFFYLLCAVAVSKSDAVSLQPPTEDLAYDAAIQLGLLNHRLNLLSHEEESRQLSLPNITLGNIVNRIPCSCDNGLCKCCAGFLSVIGMNSCTEVAYRPEEFSFELRMRVNNNIWFRQKVSGQNPPPFCFRPPRFNFAKACIQFHDIWFVGRNMHVCMYMSGEFQGFELFERNFDCLLFGDHGVKIVPPEQGYPVRPNDVDIDDGDDDIEDYDENVVRSLAETMVK